MALLAELADEGDHIHVASCNRTRLMHIAHVAQRKFGLSVREFPPFDIIDCVHTGGSYHYRKRGHCGNSSARCPRTMTGRKRRKNLAMDCSGSRQREFFNWVLQKYGRPSGWFQP